MGIQAKK